jgi:hypothetical protein
MPSAAQVEREEPRMDHGDPGGSRTPNPQIRSLMLYPVELRGHDCAPDRTAPSTALTASLGGCPYTSFCRGETWGGRWESNPQQPEPQSGALPVELLPPLPNDYSNHGGAVAKAVHRSPREIPWTSLRAGPRPLVKARALGMTLRETVKGRIERYPINQGIISAEQIGEAFRKVNSAWRASGSDH